MLVTPDRALARRVSVRLRAWALEVPDLSGRPLAGTEIGIFLDLLIAAAAERFQPVALLRLLKHPLCRAGLDAGTRADGTRALELAVFRAPYLGGSLADIVAALERAAKGTLPGAHRGRAVRQIGADAWQAARQLLASLEAILRPLEALFAAPGRTAVPTLATAHVRAAQALAAGLGEESQDALWQGDGGEEFARLFAGLLDPSMAYAPELAAADYPEFYRGLLSDQTIAPPGPRHPRLTILGPLEARLQQPDIVILGSLNEGSWPQAADPGPWFNRSMRQALGLPAPEARIGEAAHDFASLLGAGQVYLTRAGKIDGAPTVPSRWLIRLQVLSRGAGLAASAKQPWLAWARTEKPQPGAGASGVGARAAPGPSPASAPTQRHGRREMAGQSLCHLCGAHFGLGTTAGFNAHARCGPARPNRARGLEPVRPPLSRSTARRSRDPSQGRGGGRPGRPHGLAPRRRLLGAAAGTLRGLVCRDRAGAPTRRRQELCRARRGARAGRARWALYAEGAR